MPIDRKYTLKFFKVHDYHLKKSTHLNILQEIMASSREFAAKHASTLTPLVAPGKSPNLPKLIDNLIIHAVKTE